MKTLQELQQDWGNSTCGKEPEQYIYNYMEDQVQAYADQQVKAEREKVIQKVMESALAFTRYTQTVPISISELKEILLKLKSHV